MFLVAVEAVSKSLNNKIFTRKQKLQPQNSIQKQDVKTAFCVKKKYFDVSVYGMPVDIFVWLTAFAITKLNDTAKGRCMRLCYRLFAVNQNTALPFTP